MALTSTIAPAGMAGGDDDVLLAPADEVDVVRFGIAMDVICSVSLDVLYLSLAYPASTLSDGATIGTDTATVFIQRIGEALSEY